MPKTLALVKLTLNEIWGNRSTLTPIILLIMTPIVILNLLTGNDQTLGTYGSFATLIMNIAIIYAVIKLKTGSKKLSLSQVYYGGTTRFVAFMCVVALLGAQLIPALLGGLVYVSGSTGATVGLGAVEKTLLGGVWLLFSIPTFRWLTRSVFALYLIQDPDMRPIAAVRASSALVRGKSWSVFGRILIGTIFMVGVLLIPSLLISTLPETASLIYKLATGLLQIISALILVPFASMYGYNIVEALGGKPKAS